MIRVVIAEDELLVRLGLVSSIDWISCGFEVVGEASNGLDAWALCDQYNPHLVLTDIKMPQMDGLELVRKLKENGKMAKVVIISCYEDFRYAREALELGVVHYMLKADITPARLTALLIELKDQYWRDKGEDDGKAENLRKFEYERSAFLEEVLFGKIDDVKDIRSGIERFGLKLTESYYYTCAIRVNMGSENDCEAFNKRQLLADAVKGLLADSINRFGSGEVLLHSHEEILLHVSFPQCKSMKTLRESAAELFEFIRSSIKRCLGLKLMFGVSNVHSGYENMNRSCLEAYKSLEMNFFLGQDRVIYHEDLTSGERAEKMLPEVNIYFDQVIDAINKNDRDIIHAIYNELKQVFSQRQYSHQEVKWFFTCLIFKYFDQIRFLNINDMNIWENKEHPNIRISKMNTLDEVIDYFKDITFRMMEYTLTFRNNEKSLIVSRAQRYIETNYTHEISLQEISDYLNINSTYFCKLFKQIKGETFIDYLTQVRLEQAKHYLANTSSRICEISEMIGYNSAEYFCRVFHKSMGISPRQYRSGILNAKLRVK